MLDRALLASLCLLAPLGCRPEPANAPEQSPAADAGGPTAAVDAEPEGDSELESEPEGESEPSIEPATEPETESEPTTSAEPEASAEPEPEPEKSEPKPKKSERASLPKPIHKPGDGSCVKKFAVGQKVKNFRLPNLAGDKTISPAGYRNRVVLLNFWATWCKPCLEELPEFDRLYRKYRRHGMTLVAVTTDEDPKLVQDFVDDHKLAAKIALSGEEAAGQYNRPQFPFSFVVDGDGTIIAAFDYVDDACLGDLEAVIRESLEQLD